MNAAPPQLADLVRAASALAGQGRVRDADAAYARVLALDGGQPDALRFRAGYALQTGDHAAAEAWSRRLLAGAPQDAAAWFVLALALYFQERLDEALAALDASLDANPQQTRGWLYRGALLETLARRDEATASFLKAIRTAERLDTKPADAEMRQLMAHAEAVVCLELDRRIDAALAPLAARHGEAAIARIRAGADVFVGKRPARFAHPLHKPTLFCVPDLAPRMFFERDEFAWTAEVEAATDEIRAEMQQVLLEGTGFAPYVNHDPDSAAAGRWKDINRSENWSTFHFFRHGRRYEDNCRRCPRTTELLESIDIHRVPGFGPEAMFSVLRPHTRIPPHFGSVNGRVIVHLPLVVPARCGALRVGEQEREWHEGQALVFDDSFRHEAWNDSDETRVVLIFDSWNPGLTAAERAAFGAVLETAKSLEIAA